MQPMIRWSRPSRRWNQRINLYFNRNLLQFFFPFVRLPVRLPARKTIQRPVCLILVNNRNFLCTAVPVRLKRQLVCLICLALPLCRLAGSNSPRPGKDLRALARGSARPLTSLNPELAKEPKDQRKEPYG